MVKPWASVVMIFSAWIAIRTRSSDVLSFPRYAVSMIRPCYLKPHVVCKLITAHYHTFGETEIYSERSDKDVSTVIRAALIQRTICRMMGLPVR
ncbi:hypothetical protein F5879DRAFT_39150 [Lentinula edodes]|nr:hypothetical protein F5879DRAFT_39150 [Lentinula edodes]